MRLGTGGALSVPSIPRQGSALRGQIQGLNDPPQGTGRVPRKSGPPTEVGRRTAHSRRLGNCTTQRAHWSRDEAVLLFVGTPGRRWGCPGYEFRCAHGRT